MQCALCRVDRPLKNSHIIPEFLYEAMYDDIHRFTQISTKPERKNLLLQKGLREPLLCEDCEQKLSVYERYASLAFNGGTGLNVKRDGNRLVVSGLDYAKLKLFQLSILWRAGVSSLPAFRQVQLGPHEPKLRKMIADNDPGTAELYGCFMCIMMHEGEVIKDLIVQPTWARLDGQKAYRFIFGGFVWVYVVASLRPRRFISEHFLQQSGACLFRLTNMQDLTFLVKTVSEMHELGKLAP
jgi:hypothetical protein